MILEIDTEILNRIPNISINQLVILSLVLDDNQSTNQNIHKLLSLVNEEEIQDLINRELLSVTITDNAKIYGKTRKLADLLKEEKSLFDEFYDIFPVYVLRPDGTKGFLRANVNKCRKEYNRIIGRSKAMHEHLCKCLRFELQDKTFTGKLGYMKTMWKWLTQHEWEVYEEQMKLDETNNTYMYGTTIY